MPLPDLSFLNRRPFEQNRIRNFAESRGGAELVASRPVCAFVEFTTRCPYACPQCYRTVQVRRNQWMAVDMSDAVLHELETELLPHVFYVLISGVGELFASERWPRYLEAMDPFPAHKEIVTSGALIGDEAARAVASRRILLSISMDGTSQRSFDLYRGGASHAEVVAGVDRVLALSSGERIKINFTVMGGNLKEVPDMVTFCGQRGIRNLDFAPLLITEPLVADEAVSYQSAETKGVFREAVARARDLEVNLNLPLAGSFLEGIGSTRFHEDRRWLRGALVRAFRREAGHVYRDGDRCTEPWNTVLVNVFGDVAPCSVREPVGFLHRERFGAIWNGEPIRSLRRELAAGRSPGRCATCARNPRLG